MDTVEKKKFKIILNHWIEHNREHSEEYNQWAEKARNSGQDKIYDDIVHAIQQMVKVNEFLLQALDRLREG